MALFKEKDALIRNTCKPKESKFDAVFRRFCVVLAKSKVFDLI
jgi:hypothetical protein